MRALHRVVLAAKHGFVVVVFGGDGARRRVRREIHKRDARHRDAVLVEGLAFYPHAPLPHQLHLDVPGAVGEVAHGRHRHLHAERQHLPRARRLAQHGENVANLRQRAERGARVQSAPGVLLVEPQPEPLAGEGRVEHDHGHGGRAARLVALDLLDASRERAEREVPGVIGRGIRGVRAGARARASAARTPAERAGTRRRGRHPARGEGERGERHDGVSGDVTFAAIFSRHSGHA